MQVSGRRSVDAGHWMQVSGRRSPDAGSPESNMCMQVQATAGEESDRPGHTRRISTDKKQQARNSQISGWIRQQRIWQTGKQSRSGREMAAESESQVRMMQVQDQVSG